MHRLGWTGLGMLIGVILAGGFAIAACPDTDTLGSYMRDSGSDARGC